MKLTRRDMMSRSVAVIAGLSLTSARANEVPKDPEEVRHLITYGHLEKHREFVWTTVLDSSGSKPYMTCDLWTGELKRLYFKAWTRNSGLIWTGSSWYDHPNPSDTDKPVYVDVRVFEIPGVEYAEPLKIGKDCRILS